MRSRKRDPGYGSHYTRIGQTVLPLRVILRAYVPSRAHAICRRPRGTVFACSFRMSTDNKALHRLAKIVGGNRVCMMTTVGTDGRLYSRPMYAQGDIADGVLYFFTYLNSEKMGEIAHDSHVNLAFTDPDDNQYVSVAGAARLEPDEGKKKELWSTTQRAWFPDGLDTPGLALVRVDCTSAETWDAANQLLTHLWGTAKAAVTGKPPKTTRQEHVELG